MTVSKNEFDRVYERRGTGSIKWERYGDKRIIPMWVADMDFRSPPAVIEALKKRASHGIYGYSVPTDKLHDAVLKRLKRLYGWKVKKEWIVWLHGLVSGLSAACRCIGEAGDEVVIFTPIYPPFLDAAILAKRKMVTIPLLCKDNYYSFDLQSFKKVITKRTKLLLLCNPHNPVGRVFSKVELSELAKICLKNNIKICSDEIHCELILGERKHTPTATLGREIADNTITMMSAGKTFNLPGLNCGFAVIENRELRKKFRSALNGITPPFINTFGLAASLAAFRDCEDWKRKLLTYLKKNKKILYDAVNNEMKPLSMGDVEATYLAWIDARGLNLQDPAAFFKKAGVGLADGSEFGADGFLRMTFACPRKILLEAIERMKKAIRK